MKVYRGKLNIDYEVKKGFFEGVTFNLRPGKCTGASQRVEGKNEQRK